MAKTPTPNVIAAQWILTQLDANVYGPTLSHRALTGLMTSRVNEAKAEKVRAQIDKIVGKLVERCTRIVNKFENPPPKSK